MDQVKATLTVQYGMVKSYMEFVFDKDPFFSFLNRAYMVAGFRKTDDVCTWLNHVLGEKFLDSVSNKENVCFSDAFSVLVDSRTFFLLVLEGYAAHPSWREDKTTVKLFRILFRYTRNAVNAKNPVSLSFEPVAA